MGPMTHKIAYFKGHGRWEKSYFCSEYVAIGFISKLQQKRGRNFDEKMAIKGAEGKEGVVYLSVDSSMKENNGQQLLPCLPLSLLESIKELL